MDNFPAVLLVAIPFLLADYMLVYLAERTFRVYRQSRSPQSPQWTRALVAKEVSKPKRFAETDATMREIGLTLVGVYEVKLYNVKPTNVWSYRSEDSRVWGEVVYSKGASVLVNFNSIFPDDAMIVTRYPVGEAITTPMFISQYAQQSITGAYDFQRQQIATFTTAHGDAMPITTHEDTLHVDDVYRRCYFLTEFARRRRAALLGTALLVLLLTATGTFTVAVVQGQVRFVTAALLFPIGFFAALFFVLAMMRRLERLPDPVDAASG